MIATRKKKEHTIKGHVLKHFKTQPLSEELTVMHNIMLRRRKSSLKRCSTVKEKEKGQSKDRVITLNSSMTSYQ